MAGEVNGGQEAQEQGTPQGVEGLQQEAQESPSTGQAATGGQGAGAGGAGDAAGSAKAGNVGNAPDYAAQLAERDREIAELKAQAAAAAESRKRAEEMSAKIEALERRAEDDRVTYQLTLAGAKNVKAAKALLADHGGDVDKLREAEPWMFETSGGRTGGGGTGGTGLPNAGAAVDSDKQLRHFLDVAGVADKKD